MANVKAKKKRKTLTLVHVTNWVFKNPDRAENPNNLGKLFNAKNPVAFIEKKLNGKLVAKDAKALRTIIHNEKGDRATSTLVNGRPILKELHRLWLLTPRHSPLRAAKVDPWKGTT